MAEGFDVAVVGGGPAGIATAARAAEGGARVVLLDEAARPGGQIFRHRAGHVPPRAAALLDRLDRSGADVRTGVSVIDIERLSDGFRLRSDDGVSVLASRIVLATGARELLLPFPGWTLPNVLSAGGLQAMVKSGLDVAGCRVVIGGSGPLLLPVAATLARAGARIEMVCEQAGRASLARMAPWLARSPGKIGEALSYQRAFGLARYRTSTWITEAHGTSVLEAVTTNTGRRLACEFAGVSYGLVPNVELAALLGCEIRDGAVVVDREQRTTVRGVFAAGEPCGIGGVDLALQQGFRAAESVFGDSPFHPAAALHRAFALRPEVRRLARPDTIVCRCEDVRFARFDPAWSAREAKLATRAGMGPCQGRVCGPALDAIFGFGADSVRCPIKPATFDALTTTEEPQ